MEIFSILWQFLLLWGFLYVIVFSVQIITTRKREPNRRKLNNSLLPTFSIIDSYNEPPLERDEWSIKLFQIKYTTQRLNKFFSKLTTLSPSFWKIWFTCGVLAAGVLMIVGSVVIVFASFKILSSLGQIVWPSQHSNLSKRGLDSQGDDQVFLPMIPGVTLPMSHIGYYLIALLVCGLFHEAGHAIASYSQGVPIQSSGMFVLYLYPGAFVNISDQLLQNLNPFKQLRIMCAGVWHNLVLYLYCYISLAGGLKLMLLLLGWSSLEGHGGVGIIHVRSSSPLAAHLPPGGVIYQLDDTPLVNNIDTWNEYLLTESAQHTIYQGFCTTRGVEDYGPECCQISEDYPFGQSKNASLSCFNPFPVTGKKEDRFCLPSVQVLSSTNPERCYKSSDCTGVNTECIVPYTPTTMGQVVRIYTRFPVWLPEGDEYNEKVFVFEGELVDIWESVKVSLLSPNYWILPASLPHILELLLRYVSSFTIALAMLNILPAFKLDGEFAIEQFLILFFQPKDSVQMTTRSHETHRFVRKIHETIIKITSVFVGFVIVGSILVGLIFSKI